MSGQNENTHRRPLTFSSKKISAELVQGLENYTISGRRIVLNLGSNPIFLPGCPTQSVPPLQSTILIDAEIRRVETAIIVSITEDVVSGKLVDDPGWDLYADLVENPSVELRATPLFRSSQDTIGSRIFDARTLGVVTKNPNAIERFDVKVNLWFAPAGTNCLIHRYHPFVETHVQILGSGRMQKFRDQSYTDLYEEIFMSPGFTQPFFHCIRDAANGFEYPWHQYYAETDCIWMAIEFHPLAGVVKATA